MRQSFMLSSPAPQGASSSSTSEPPSSSSIPSKQCYQETQEANTQAYGNNFLLNHYRGVRLEVQLVTQQDIQPEDSTIPSTMMTSVWQPYCLQRGNTNSPGENDTVLKHVFENSNHQLHFFIFFFLYTVQNIRDLNSQELALLNYTCFSYHEDTGSPSQQHVLSQDVLCFTEQRRDREWI